MGQMEQALSQLATQEAPYIEFLFQKHILLSNFIGEKWAGRWPLEEEPGRSLRQMAVVGFVS